MVKVRPLFLFSLPRSGSTLLQRILGAHHSIATTSEPWILLPLIYTLREKGIYTEYRHATAMIAIEDFYNEMPKGVADYLAEIRSFVLNLYSKVSKDNSIYFLDKTPRYHLIVEDIIQLFPEGKFIFLWRNPLSIVASLINSFGKGRWDLFHYQVDLYDGLANLISISRKYQPQICQIRFEALIKDPLHELEQILSYLDLPLESKMLNEFNNVDLKGHEGDRIGSKEYNHISFEPLDKWKFVLSNHIRKRWCKHYLKWIGSERLGFMGYDLDNLISDLNSITFSINYLPSDVALMIFGLGYRFFEPRIFKHKLLTLPDWHNIHSHT